MKIEEIRAKAPEGATHYIVNNDDIIYIKNEMIWFRESWWFATFQNKGEIKPL